MHFFTKKPHVIFLYSKRYRFTGSTVMRGQQLSYIIGQQYGNVLKVKYKEFSLKYRNSILILTKGAYLDISIDDIRILQTHGNRVLLDIVDAPLDNIKMEGADCIIAPSLEAFDHIKSQGYRTYLINHHVDPRINTKALPLDDVNIGYFGEIINTIKTKSIAEHVTFTPIDTSKQGNDWFDIPRRYNVHYAVRSENVEAFKPFLKGFTAAACNACVIIQKDQTEAVRWLGKDYPFLLPAHPNESQILSMIKYVKKSYNSPTWRKAQTKMEYIKTAILPQKIAADFLAMTQAL